MPKRIKTHGKKTNKYLHCMECGKVRPSSTQLCPSCTLAYHKANVKFKEEVNNLR